MTTAQIIYLVVAWFAILIAWFINPDPEEENS